MVMGWNSRKYKKSRVFCCDFEIFSILFANLEQTQRATSKMVTKRKFEIRLQTELANFEQTQIDSSLYGLNANIWICLTHTCDKKGKEHYFFAFLLTTSGFLANFSVCKIVVFVEMVFVGNVEISEEVEMEAVTGRHGFLL